MMRQASLCAKACANISRGTGPDQKINKRVNDACFAKADELSFVAYSPATLQSLESSFQKYIKFIETHFQHQNPF